MSSWTKLTFTATSYEVLVVPSKAGVNGVEALGHSVELSNQGTGPSVPHVDTLKQSLVRRSQR